MAELRVALCLLFAFFFAGILDVCIHSSKKHVKLHEFCVKSQVLLATCHVSDQNDQIIRWSNDILFSPMDI
jgi:hypothetical protein